MQSPVSLLSVLTIPPGATTQQARIVLDGVRGAIFVYAAGNPSTSLVGSWAGVGGTDPYGNVYPEGFSGNLGVLASTTFLVYSGVPANGNLIGSWSSTGGTDVFGNVYPAGLFANQLQLSGGVITNPQIIAATINSALINNPNINQPAVSGGTIVETSITFDNVGGKLLVYSTSTTNVQFTTAGLSTWTAPAGVTSAKIECWGADAGAGGGSSSRGGEGGGGGEYASEPNYPIVPGNVYNVTVGSGGFGGTTGTAGGSGTQSNFDNQGVVADGGHAGSNFQGGAGGNLSTNTTHFAGGIGGGNGNQSTGGCGGGGRAGSTGPGGNGATSNSSTGAAGGAAGTGTGGHAGGNGGNAAANGNNGGGGGGCGAANQATQGSNTYRLSSSATYFGSDAASGAPPNGQRNTGTMYQGGETASGGSFNGTQKSLGIISGNPSSDLSGKTIDSVKIRLEWLHTWYNNGAYVGLGYNGRTSLPSSWDASDITAVTSWWQDNVGSPVTTDVTGHGLGTALQNGSAKAITLGPGTPPFDLYNYGYMYGAGGDNNQNPLITVNWHTGSQPVTAGNGADGQVQITYASGQTLIAAIAPAAGTDANSNAFGQGFTGTIQAFQPSSSPTAVETWHSVTLPSTGGFTGTIRVKKVAEFNFIVLDVQVQWTNTTNATFTGGNLPSGYYPTVARLLPMGYGGTQSADNNAHITVPTSGGIQITTDASSGGSGSTGQSGGTYLIPLD